jgi:hypothetical protein
MLMKAVPAYLAVTCLAGAFTAAVQTGQLSIIEL